MNLTYKTLSFKASTEGDGLTAREFDGYASTFLGGAAKKADSYGDLIAPGAFAENLEWFLENGLLLREHNIRCAIGRPVEAKEDAEGLYLKGYISATADGNDALTLLRDKVIKKMSIGFTTEGYEMLSEARGIELLGSQAAYDAALRALPWYSDGLRLLTAIKLYEVSLVAFPANEDAIITGVKSSLREMAGKIETERDFERFLRDAGFTATEAKTIVSIGYKALQRDAEANAGNSHSPDPQPESITLAGADELAASIKKMTAALRG